MVDVESSRGGFVKVEVKGVAEAMRKMIEKAKMIKDGFDAKTFQAANFLQQEIQESIIGNRSETKSVDTGNFANSIEVDKIADGKFSVETDVPYAKHLEYGTAYMNPRMHFRNSIYRNKAKVIDIIKK